MPSSDDINQRSLPKMKVVIATDLSHFFLLATMLSYSQKKMAYEQAKCINPSNRPIKRLGNTLGNNLSSVLRKYSCSST